MALQSIPQPEESRLFDKIRFIEDCERRGAINLANSTKDAWEAVWNDEDPQALLDMMGPEGIAKFQRCAAAVAFIVGVDPGFLDSKYYAVPAGKAADPAPDGSRMVITDVPTPPGQ